MSRVRGLRGATTVAEDTRQEVMDSTAELLQAMMERNGVERDDLVTIIFTATPDITSEFPAAAARSIGISDVPLLCACEIDVQGSKPLVIRILMHIYTEKSLAELRHVYLKDTQSLRTDLPQ
jgi:chorismate mutase